MSIKIVLKFCRSLFALVLVVAAVSTAQSQEISRGNQVLLQRGLQIQGLANGVLNTSTFAQSNFTSVAVLYGDSTTLGSFNPAPGIPWGLLDTDDHLTPGQLPYLSNLVSLQYNDENSITDPVFLNDAKNSLATWRSNYPNAIGYTNQYAGQHTSPELQSYMSYVQPDMLMFDFYPFQGSLLGGSPTYYYTNLQQFRQLGLAGNDGSGNLPIPTGNWLQSYTDGGSHPISPSEMRLNQFAPWTFGYKFAAAYVYSTTSSAGTLSTPSVLFEGEGDGSRHEPQFSAMAETNRQSRNLGDALVRLQTTDVAIVPGQHKGGVGGQQNITNSLPSGVPLWTNGAGSDPYLTSVSASNIGGANSGLRGDVLVGHFKPMQGPYDDYFMITNGLSTGAGTVTDAAQLIHLTFDFGASGINSLQRKSRNTGQVEVVPLTHDGGSLYYLNLTLEGGTGDLFKYNNGLPFVTPAPEPATIVNGDFTDFTGGLPDGWTANAPGGGTPGERDTSSPDGSCWSFVPYGRIEQGNVGPALVEGQTYRVSFLAASPQPAFPSANLNVRIFDNTSFDLLGGLEITSGLTETWAPFFFEFTATAANAGHLMYPYITTGNGVTGIDNIQITELGTLLGDYNDDEAVDAADYTTWRTAFGSSVFIDGSGADGNGNGVVDAADYVIWRKQLAAVVESALVVTVPEPTCLPAVVVFLHFWRKLQ